jgi:hypothetical protein
VDKNGSPPALVRGFGSSADDRATAVSIGPQGEIVFTGFLGGAATFRNQSVGGNTAREPFAAKLDPAGLTVWGRAFGTSPPATASAIALHPGGIAVAQTGDIAMGGAFVGNLLFGATNLANNGQFDMFLARLQP